MTKEFLEQLLTSIYQKVDNKVVVLDYKPAEGDSSPYPEGTLCLVLSGTLENAYSIKVYWEDYENGRIEFITTSLKSPVEEEYNGERKKKRKLRWFTSFDKALEAEVPEEKLLSGGATVIKPDADGFMNIPDAIDEELPFN